MKHVLRPRFWLSLHGFCRVYRKTRWAGACSCHVPLQAHSGPPLRVPRTYAIHSVGRSYRRGRMTAGQLPGGASRRAFPRRRGWHRPALRAAGGYASPTAGSRSTATRARVPHPAARGRSPYRRVLFAPLQELDKRRTDNPRGMALVGIATLALLIWQGRRVWARTRPAAGGLHAADVRNPSLL